MKLIVILTVFWAAGILSTLAQGTWTYGEMPNKMLLRMGVATLGNKIYIAGGARGDFSVTSKIIDIYDIKTGLWSSANLSVAREMPAGVACGSKLFFAGGVNLENMTHFSNVDIYDTITSQWTTAHLSQPRMAVAAMSDGNRVLFAGGVEFHTRKAYATVDIYNSHTQSWSTESLSEPRAGFGYAAAGSKAVIAGGFNGTSVTDQVDIYDFTTGKWSTRKLSQARGFIAATAVGNKVIFAGGVTAPNTPSDRVDIYDAANDTWTTARLSVARAPGGAATACGKAFFAGGGNINIATLEWSSATDVVDIYDPATGIWSTTKLQNPVFNLGMTSNANVVYFIGGVDLTLIFSGFNQYTCLVSLSPAASQPRNKFSISPNPASTKLHLTLYENSPAVVTITNLAGNKLLHETYTGKETFDVEIRNLKTGVYLVGVQTSTWFGTEKLIIGR